MVKRVLRLAIVDDYPVVVAGVASFLASESIDVVETGAMTPVLTEVDIVLYDTFGQVQGVGIDLQDFVRDSGAKVVIYSWNIEPEMVSQAMAGGASGYLSKVLTGPEVVAALERVVRGEVVVLTGEYETSVEGVGDWPGRSVGLSPREAEVLALITQGLTNQEIADRVFLSTNTVKTYIRSAYRKIGVERRPQAIVWGMANGFEPDALRTVDRALLRRPRPQARRPPGAPQVLTAWAHPPRHLYDAMTWWGRDSRPGRGDKDVCQCSGGGTRFVELGAQVGQDAGEHS